MALATAILGGFVGALVGLLIALLGQSREDERLRRAEEWRQRTAKQERLRREFATALELVYEVHVATGLFQWVPPSQAAKDPTYEKRRAKLEELYEEAKAADILLRLEGATDAWRAVSEVVKQHQVFRDALLVLDDSRISAEERGAARVALPAAHEAISAIASNLHETLAANLEALTPPGPLPPRSGLRSWLREAVAWLRR